MSLEALFPDRPQPAKPVRLTIRRRLLGRGARLRTLGVAVGLLSLGLTYGLPARASTKSWIGPDALTDWYANSTFWSTTGFPQASDDAVNSALTKPMTLGADTSVNSFFSNSAFTLNGGAFSGSQLNSASTIQVNNVFTLNGGTINNFTLNAGVQQTGGPAPSSVVVTSNLSTLSNTIVNANVDMTNPNAYLRLLNANTVNGAITMATTSHGLDIYSTNDSLTLSATGSLTGFGNVYQDGSGGFLINNGLVNANVSGKTLALTQTNTTNNSGGTLEATNGGTLNLNNTTVNKGTLSATGGGTLNIGGQLTSFATGSAVNLNGAGGTVNINSATLLGTINGASGTTLVFGGNNAFNATTITANLDLSTNNTARILMQGANTVTGNISLGTSGANTGLDIYSTNDALTINGNLTGFGNVYQDGSGGFLTSNGAISANVSGKTLALTQINTVVNGTAQATNGATLLLSNTTNNGAISATGAGSVVGIAGAAGVNKGTLSATGGGTLNIGGQLTSSTGSAVNLNGAGGTVNINSATLLGTINGASGTTLVFGGVNAFNATTVTANLDLSTNNTTRLLMQGANTVTGNISLGTSGASTGLDIYNTNDSLTLGATGSLTGFGNVYQDGSGGFLVNNGLVSANVSGKTLSLGQSNFATTGATQVTKGATLNVTSTSFTQTAGLTQVDGVLNLVNAPLALKGGVLDGSGTINGNVVNTGGTVSPGDSPGTLTIAGNYTQGSGGALDIEFTNSLHDLLNVTGLATTGGLLDVNFLDSAYTGGVGSQFAFLDYGTLAAGSGSNFGFTVTGHNGFTYTVVNDASNKMLDLQVLTVGAPAVPEASTTVSLGLLLALGLGGLAVAAKRRKSVRA